MHQADLSHSHKSLEEKLNKIFQLRRTKTKVNWDPELYHKLLADFGNPHLNLPPVIHVAGTNGKGSVIAMLRSILEASGKRVHVYTSPHLIHVNERITLSGKHIDNAQLEALIDEALSYIDDAPLSFFEIITAVAFKAFSQVPADILLLEVGMGGRLDCTNVIAAPVATVINRISLDHTEFLGDDIAQIAAQKSGIIKQKVPCFIGYQGHDNNADIIHDVIQREAHEQGVQAVFYGDDFSAVSKDSALHFKMGSFEEECYALPALIGEHQIYNAALAIAVIKALPAPFSEITNDHINNGLLAVQWPGRLQRLDAACFGLSNDTEIWLDCGHNDSAGEALAEQVRYWDQDQEKENHLIFAMLGQKDAKGFLSPLSEVIHQFHLVPIANDPSSKTVKDINLDGFPKVISVQEHTYVFEAIKNSARGNSRVIIAGSVYLAGEVLQAIEKA